MQTMPGPVPEIPLAKPIRYLHLQHEGMLFFFSRNIKARAPIQTPSSGFSVPAMSSIFEHWSIKYWGARCIGDGSGKNKGLHFFLQSKTGFITERTGKEEKVIWERKYSLSSYFCAICTNRLFWRWKAHQSSCQAEHFALRGNTRPCW